MRTIHKFPVYIGTTFEIRAGETFKPLCMQMQDGKPQIWAEVETAEEAIWRHPFVIVGTGHPVPPGFDWIATVQDGAFVWHLYGALQ